MNNYKAGFVAIVGQPNVGKSTLTNVLIGEKVSIVSPKPQTTRQRVAGLWTAPEYQIVFVDAPGFIEAEKGLNKFLQDEAIKVMSESDVLILLIGADASENQAKKSLDKVLKVKKPFKVFVTKADAVKPGQKIAFTGLLDEHGLTPVYISAEIKPERAKERILQAILEMLPQAEGPLYEEDIYTTQTLREMTTEFIREQCFLNLHQEVPYGLCVVLQKYDETDPKCVRIACDIYVERENQKAIVIGKGGQTLKAIGMGARKELEKIIGRKVFLELYATVKPAWNENHMLMKELGYVVRKS